MRSILYSFSILLSVCIFLLASQSASAQYCVNNLYYFGCNYGDEIDDISVGTISQTATGCSANGYGDYTSLSSNFEQGSTYTLQVKTQYYGDVISMWIDFNDDFIFDPSEKLVSYLSCPNPNIMYSANFIIPWTATLGSHRMRVRDVEYPYPFPFDACTEMNYGEVHDYTAVITPPVDMSFVSSTTTQTVTTNVSLGTNDVQVIGIQVITSGSLNALSVTSLELNSNGSTNYLTDVTNAKIYYTGTDPNFSATNLFGSGNLPTAITGSQILAQGVNYFWLAYDVSSGATIDDYIDGECTSITVGGSSYTPTVTAPAGNRQLGYCIPVSQYGCYFAYIDGIELNTLSNLVSYCNGNANGYINYAPMGNLTTALEIGTSYQISITGSAYTSEGFGVWIDFNNDGDFSDGDEFVYGSPFTATGTQIGTVSVPNNPSYIGTHRMRVRCGYYAIVTSDQSCLDFQYGETEDYTITINTSSPMVFLSSTCTQNNTDFVQTGTSDVEIIGIQVATSGALTPFDLTSFDINANGSDNFLNDVSSAKIYYTGSNPTFNTTTLFGSSATLPATITGNVTLSSGTNYFWVAYDVTNVGFIGDLLDAECTSITMTGNGGVQVPTVTAPVGSRQIDYCVPVNQYGCYYGYINSVVLNTLSNLLTGCNGNAGSYIQYPPTGNYTTSLELGGTYSISITGSANYYDYAGYGVWMDFNNDGDFNDSGEFPWASPNYASGTQIGSITVPATATLGEHRMRIRSSYYGILNQGQACGETFYNGESEDYTFTITPQTNMSYVSSTVTQDNTTSVTSGVVDAEIIGIQVVTAGSLSPFNLTSLHINETGTSDFAGDVTNVRVWYTGSNPAFSTGTLFGSTTTLPADVSGSTTLAAGINYFWVTYDVSTNATLGNFLDAECTSVSMSGAGGIQTPSVTAPAGNREINYCIGVNTYGCYYSYINGVTVNTLINTSTFCNGNVNGYIEYPQSGNTTTQLELGQTYSLQLDGPNYYYVGFGVWIDYNGNGSFDDPGDFVYSSPYLSAGTQYGTIALPCDADFVGDRRMRVRANYYTLVGDTQSCTTFYNGETEDYTITLSPPSTNQTYSSSTCSQNNTNTVATGTPDAEIIGIQLSAAGCLNPLTVASFTLNEAGTTDFFGDVTNVKIYYTGTDPNFAPVNLFGSVTDLSVPITGSQNLNSGTNYFWVTYDISANATLLDYVDAACTAIDITGYGVVTPDNSSPFGERQINSCVPVIPNPCYYGDYINNVTFNTLSNLYSGCNGNVNNYINYAPSGNYTTSVQGGFTYTFTISSGFYPMGFGVWIDYNNNDDFGDVGEFVYVSPTYGYNFTGPITIPVDPSFYGLRRMRVRGVDYAVPSAQDYCSNNFYSGETEDYKITIDPPPACTGTPDPGTIDANPTILCAAGVVDLTLSGFTAASGLAFQWQNSPDGSTWSNIPGETNTSYSVTLSTTTYYQMVVTCTNTGDVAITPSVLVVVGGNVAITSTVGATICGEGSVDLTATGNSDLVIWYDSPTSTTPLYTSISPSTYSTYVNATTTYYVSAAAAVTTTGNVGPVDDNIGSQVSYYSYVGEYFNVLKADTLVGVYVYPTSAGDVILELNDQNYGGQIALITYPVTAYDINQKTFIPINYALSVGNNYMLRQNGGVNLMSNDYSYPPYPYPYTLEGVISITQSTYGTYYYLNVYDWVVKYTDLCESARTPITATVTAAPEITVTANPANATICAGSGNSVALDVTPGSYTSFTWSPPDGLSSTVGTSVTASPSSSTQYIVTASDGYCTNLDTVFVYVSLAPDVTVTASPDVVCAGGSSQLDASAPTGYSVIQIPFAPDLSNGGTTVTLSDDQVSTGQSLGFTFNFFGNNYTQFYISSNGFISFDATAGNGCCQGQLLPDPASPNNVIALAWEDLYPPAGGTIRYYTVGSAPYRKCVIEYNNIMHYPSPGNDPVNMQAILYETTNFIEIHTTSMPGNPNGYWAGHTEGIENSDGTLALWVPGRNQDATWTATNDAWLFMPPQNYIYEWTPSGTLDDAAISNPLATPTATTTYTVTVTNALTSCSATSTITVNLTTTPLAGTVTPDLTDFCGSGSAVLEVIGYTPGATIQWGESPTSGGPYTDIPGETNDTYTTPTVNTTTYYAVTATCDNGATSTEGTVHVDLAPNAPVGIDGFNCGPGVVVLGATGSGNGQLNWFYSQNGYNYLGSGSPFTTPFINQTTTFYVEEGGPAVSPLSAGYNGYNTYYYNGNMFDVTALNDIYLTGFDVNMGSFYSADFEIYYKIGTYVGSENSSQNWTFLGTAPSVQGLGDGVPTPLPLPLYLHVMAGQTIGLYVTCATYSSYPDMTFGTAIGNVYAQDANLQVKEGYASPYPFGYGYGPYKFNGTIHYVLPGCASERTPVLAEITTPQVAATVSATTVCEGDPITLVITNYGQQSFNYEWMPQLPGMLPQNGMDDTVTVTPPVTMTFTVSVTDPNAPLCDTMITVDITVSPTPVVFISGLATQYYDNVTSVVMTGIPSGGTFSGQGVTGNEFSPSSVGPGVYIITYTYTDANGCTGSYEQQVKVLQFNGIGNIEIDKDILVFPNPSEGLFNMTMALPSPAQSVIVTIYDQIGQRVFANDYGAVQKELTSTFDFSISPKGSYYMTINVDGEIFYRKVTIQ